MANQETLEAAIDAKDGRLGAGGGRGQEVFQGKVVEHGAIEAQGDEIKVEAEIVKVLKESAHPQLGRHGGPHGFQAVAHLLRGLKHHLLTSHGSVMQVGNFFHGLILTSVGTCQSRKALLIKL